MFKTVKNLLKKSEAARQDPYLALLSRRFKPIDTNLPSPAKIPNKIYLAVDGYSAPKPWNVIKHRDVQKQPYDGRSPRELQKLVPSK